jgi:ribosomal protein S18 acetylase RimI-like enzyme
LLYTAPNNLFHEVTTLQTNILYSQLSPEHFAAILALGNFVHGENYLDDAGIKEIYANSWCDNINGSWVAIDTSYESGEGINDIDDISNDSTNTPDPRRLKEGYLVGFRLTLAPQKWAIDKWCTPEEWVHEPNDVCYFKCNTVDNNYRGQGVGKALLFKSIESAKQQGAKAGLAHIWLASPNNSAFGYFSACGGKLIKEHPNKWQIHSIEDDYECPVCIDVCYCAGAEMLLSFAEIA